MARRRKSTKKADEQLDLIAGEQLPEIGDPLFGDRPARDADIRAIAEAGPTAADEIRGRAYINLVYSG